MWPRKNQTEVIPHCLHQIEHCSLLNVQGSLLIILQHGIMKLELRNQQFIRAIETFSRFPAKLRQKRLTQTLKLYKTKCTSLVTYGTGLEGRHPGLLCNTEDGKTQFSGNLLAIPKPFCIFVSRGAGEPCVEDV